MENDFRRFINFVSIDQKAGMKVLLDIKDNKATHLLEVLKGLSYVKATPIAEEKAVLIKEIKEAVHNLKLVRKGKLKARPAKDLLNEL
jgi:hypothetical protein